MDFSSVSCSRYATRKPPMARVAALSPKSISHFPFCNMIGEEAADRLLPGRGETAAILNIPHISISISDGLPGSMWEMINPDGHRRCGSARLKFLKKWSENRSAPRAGLPPRQ